MHKRWALHIITSASGGSKYSACARFSVCFLSACESRKLFYSLLTIVLSATSSASSEDTLSTHEIGRISAEVFSDDDESSLLYRGSCGIMMSCLLALVCLFFLWCMVACMVVMLANAGQEVDSA